MSERELKLKKAGGRVHDELWSQWGKICESKLKRLVAGSITSLEERLFTALVACNSDIGIAFMYHEARVKESFV